MQQKYVLSKNQLQKTIKTFSTYFFHKMFLQHSAKHFFFFLKHSANIFWQHSAKHLKNKFDGCISKLSKKQLQKTLKKPFLFITYDIFLQHSAKHFLKHSAKHL